MMITRTGVREGVCSLSQETSPSFRLVLQERFVLLLCFDCPSHVILYDSRETWDVFIHFLIFADLKPTVGKKLFIDQNTTGGVDSLLYEWLGMYENW